MDYGLNPQAIATIHEILRGFPQVKRAILFGSRAKGCARPGSDIDLTLEGESLDESIVSEIDTAFYDSLLPYRFSLSVRSLLRDRDFLAHIERVGVTFYEREC